MIFALCACVYGSIMAMSICSFFVKIIIWWFRVFVLLTQSLHCNIPDCNKNMYVKCRAPISLQLLNMPPNTSCTRLRYSRVCRLLQVVTPRGLHSTPAYPKWIYMYLEIADWVIEWKSQININEHQANVCHRRGSGIKKNPQKVNVVYRRLKK